MKKNFVKGHDYSIRTAPRAFLIGTVFIDCLKTTVFAPNAKREQNFRYERLIVRLLDGHATNGMIRALV
jgi:hypothetical protein